MALFFRVLGLRLFSIVSLDPLGVWLPGTLRLLALSLSAATFTFTRAGATPTEAVAHAVVRQTTQSFGRVERGTVLSGSFVIENAGSSALTIESMEFSSPGVRGRVAQTIAPDSSAKLVVDWDTANYARDAEVQVALQVNDPAAPRLVLTLSCFVVSPIELAPVPAFYLSQFVGETASQTITMRNNTELALTITGTAGDGGRFRLAVKPVSPGRTFELKATANPRLQPGEYQESAWVLTDNPDRPKIRLDVNILVKSDGSVRLLDFGIAKQLQSLDRPADPTMTGLRLMTPAYAAPEQIRGEGGRVQTDVYSLGVILYELLAGQLPFDLSSRTPGEAATIIVENDPERPSIVAGRAFQWPDRPPFPALSKGSWADLDVLCLTAMHKDPLRRYRSVEAVIRDIDHYLDGQPLDARPDTLRYRLTKFIRRNRGPVMAAAVVLAAVIALTAFYTVRLKTARDAALAEAFAARNVKAVKLLLTVA